MTFMLCCRQNKETWKSLLLTQMLFTSLPDFNHAVAAWFLQSCCLLLQVCKQGLKCKGEQVVHIEGVGFGERLCPSQYGQPVENFFEIAALQVKDTRTTCPLAWIVRLCGQKNRVFTPCSQRMLTLLYDSLSLVVNRFQLWTVTWPQLRRKAVESFALQQLDCVEHTYENTPFVCCK